MSIQRLIWPLLLVLLLSGFGCTELESLQPEQPVAATAVATLTQPALLPITATATIPATTMPTFTATAPPATHTAIPLPPTATPEPTATPTPWPFDPPTGQIFFFYAAETWYDMGYERLVADEYNLYRADATGNPANWHITTIFTQTLPGSAQLSPDQTKIGFRLIHDTDGDGQLRSTGYTPDLRDIFVYDLPQASWQQLTVSSEAGSSPNNPVWMPDGKAVLVEHSNRIVKIPVDEGIPEIVLSLPDFAFGGWRTLSPDGNLLVFTTTGPVIDPEQRSFQGNTLLHTFRLDTETLTLVHDHRGGLFNILQPAWSPDSQSLIFGSHGNMFVLDTNASELSPLIIAEEDDYISPQGWSADGRWLSAIKNNDTFLLWDSTTETALELLTGDGFRHPVWSTRENQLAITLVNGDSEEMLLINAETGSTQTLLPPSTRRHSRPYSWSPNGDWLLLYLEEPEQSGLYILHPDTGAIFPVIDSTGGLVGYVHVWSPD